MHKVYYRLVILLFCLSEGQKGKDVLSPACGRTVEAKLSRWHSAVWESREGLARAAAQRPGHLRTLLGADARHFACAYARS